MYRYTRNTRKPNEISDQTKCNSVILNASLLWMFPDYLTRTLKNRLYYSNEIGMTEQMLSPENIEATDPYSFRPF